MAMGEATPSLEMAVGMARVVEAAEGRQVFGGVEDAAAPDADEQGAGDEVGMAF